MLRTAVSALAAASVFGAALWQGTDGLRAFTTEGARDALTPMVPHMSPYAYLGAGYGILALLMFLGLRAFVRRVLS